MSVWSKENCKLTAIGNEALTEISTKGGRMTFDSVWTCSTRVEPNALYGLLELPNRIQQMTLVRYTQVSGGYTINVQVTNENLNTPYNIEMVGVYMKLDGFNEGNPFLYMVLLADEGSADEMTNISRSTYKYAIYLYHTNQAILNISLDPSDYVATDTYEAGIKVLEDEIRSSVYHADYTYVDTDGYIRLYTENFDTNPFVRPSQNPVTEHPIVVIHNFKGYLTGVEKTADGGNLGVYIDDVGPFTLMPYDLTTYPKSVLSNLDLLCTVMSDSYIRVNNYFLSEDFIPKNSQTYSSFNGVPFKEGIYSVLGNATNGPVTLGSTDVWTCIVIKSVDIFIMLALNNVDDKIYRRTRSVSGGNWSNSSVWKHLGGGKGIQTATAQFVTSTGSASTSGTYLRITRDDTTEALKAGDVLACTLSDISTLKDSKTVNIKFVDSTNVTKILYRPDAYTFVPCCQLPKHFLVKYDDNGNFILLTPLNTTTTLSTDDPTSTTGKYGDIWYTY